MGPVLAVLVRNGINTKEALGSVAKVDHIKSAIAEELPIRSKVIFSILCSRAATSTAKKESKELSTEDMNKMLSDFQRIHGSAPLPTLMSTKPAILQKMKKPEQAVRMDLNEFLPRREVISTDDNKSFKVNNSGQLVMSSTEKRKLSGFTELSVALFRWGVTYSILFPPVVDGSPSKVGLSV